MRILMPTSEVVPFSKTGGLADVCGALPVELEKLGHEVALITPAYRQAKDCGLPLEPIGVTFEIPIGSRIVTGSLLKGTLPNSQVPVYFVDQPEYFDRKELYRENNEDYRDNCERFVFFSRAVMESIRLLDLNVDILHCNDWPTGLIPAYQRIEYQHTPRYESIATLLTIHNLAYQGRFWHWDMLLTGLDWKYFNWHQMEFYGDLNLMKTGIAFADAISAVSPRYSQEIQSAAFGCGLEGALRDRADVLCGILNGVDYSIWSPEHDPHLPANYSVSNWEEGKAACKVALQREMKLPERADVPLVGFIGRLASQKGLDLLHQVLGHWAQHDETQWVFLGSGDEVYQRLLQDLAAEYPQRVAVQLGFSNALAHRIEAGSDIFAMPSQYEPCGLNQMYSLKYGAVPVVHATGGLADTITDAYAETIDAGTANGFSFNDYHASALDDALRRARQAYNDKPTWKRIVEIGMQQDWSWGRSAREYAELYKTMHARRLQTAGV